MKNISDGLIWNIILSATTITLFIIMLQTFIIIGINGSVTYAEPNFLIWAFEIAITIIVFFMLIVSTFNHFSQQIKRIKEERTSK